MAEEICYWIRDYSQAFIYAAQSLELAPTFPRAHYILARIYEAQGMIEEMITEYKMSGIFTESGAVAARQAFMKGGVYGYYQWALDMQLGAMGDPPIDGERTLPRKDERAIFRARNFAKLGDADNAIKCLEQAYEERDGRMVLVKTWVWFDSLRSDARFQDIVRRVGIP